MVDWSKISAGLADRIKDIITSEGEDRETAKLDKHSEYQKLSQLLSGDGKVTGEEKGFIEGMLKDYEEAYLVRSEVRERVLDIIKNGEKMQADDKAEVAELKKYAGTNGLTKEEKNWIKDVINGRVVKELPAKENGNITEVGNSEVTEEEEKNKTVPNKTSEGANVKPRSTEKTEEESGVSVNPDKKKPENGAETEPKRPPNQVPGWDKPNTKPTPPVFVPVPPVGDNDVRDDKDYHDDKDINDNKGAVLQSGMGNINIESGATVNINIYNGHPNVAVPGTGVTPGSGEDPTAPIDDTKGADKPTVEEAKKARDNGEKVADALLGHTSNTEQMTVQNIVNEEVNSGNVIDFLRGYEKGLQNDKGMRVGPAAAGVVPGIIDLARPRDHFFEQMRTENNFPEQQELMRKVAGNLQGYLANKYGVDSDVAREVAIILCHEVLDKEQAKALDEIYQKELGMGQDTRAPQYRVPMTGAMQLGIDAIKDLTE